MGLVILASDAARLAQGVYAVNSGERADLKGFLRDKLFAESSGPSARPNAKILKASVGGRVLRATKDSFGICARGAGTYKNDLFLIFRGTTEANNKADFVTDARIGITSSKTGLPVHIGFNHAFNSMQPEIKKFIVESKTTGTVHCIGHSLGGAVASLAADWVSKTLSKKIRLYTFGAPRVGTDWFVKSTTNSIGNPNMYRVYHKTDPVPMVALYPFMQAPYNNPGYYIYSEEPLTSGMAHSMDKYVSSVRGKSWEQLMATPPQPYGIEKAIETWLKSKSPVDSSSPSFWRWVESALIYVVKKITMKTILQLQGAFIGAFTLADKIAYILAKGIDLAENISVWVEHLMRKLMQALGMRVAKSRKELTRDLIRRVLMRITEKASKDARNALRNL